MWELAGFKRKLRPEWAKKQELAVKIVGARPIREKITARMGKKARISRKFSGVRSCSRENYGQNGRKSKFWP